MRHVNPRGAALSLRLFELLSHLQPALAVQCAKRFIEQDRLGPRNQGPRQGDPLLFAARKSFDAPSEETRNSELIGDDGDSFLISGPGIPAAAGP